MRRRLKKNLCLIAANKDLTIKMINLLNSQYILFIEPKIDNAINIIKTKPIDCIMFSPYESYNFWYDLSFLISQFPNLIYCGIIDDNRMDIAHKIGLFSILGHLKIIVASVHHDKKIEDLYNINDIIDIEIINFNFKINSDHIKVIGKLI